MAQKKLVIRAFHHSTSMDSTTAVANLDALGAAIDQIYGHMSSQLSYEQLYRKAYNMVLQRQGDLLYEGIKNILSKHLHVSATVVEQSTNDHFLHSLVKEWTAHEVAFSIIKGVLLYMDKSYCGNARNPKPLIYDAAVELFRDVVVYQPTIRARLHRLVLEQIQRERLGLVIDRQILRDTLSMLLCLGNSAVEPTVTSSTSSSSSSSTSSPSLSSSPQTATIGLTLSTVYIDEFENPFLAATSAFYHAESLNYLAQSTCPEYLVKIESRFMQETARVANYLAHSTKPRLMECLEQELIITHARTLLSLEGSGLHVLLTENKLDDLKRLYSLFARVPACAELLRDSVGKYIVYAGTVMTQGQDINKDPTGFVRDILDLKDKFDEINKVAFKKDNKIAKTIKDSFEAFVNQDKRCASHLATYVDEQLKANAQNDLELEIKLEKVMVIFRYISDKDIFENFYKLLLAKRLLNGKSTSYEHEHLMIAKLKSESGYQFTSKLEGMFQDMNMSINTMQEYSRSSQSLTSPLELEIQLLTTGFWPLPCVPSCTLPTPLRELCLRFENFYSQKNSGRKLSWMTQLGAVDVKVCSLCNSVNGILSICNCEILLFFLFLFSFPARQTFRWDCVS
jgi:cullin 3